MVALSEAISKHSLKGFDSVKKAAELQETIKKKGEIKFRISSDDMAPTIKSGDRVRAVKTCEGGVKRGTIVVIVKDGDIVVKRVQKIINDATTPKVSLTNGTSSKEIIVTFSQIIGKVTDIKRGEQKIIIDADISGGDLLKADLGTIIKRLFKIK
ncbi:MAG: S24/S26 family peptidase [Candidatus Eremiobacteraeota bacterium]|nr:S24/S26 family peptidase [Candidatus Eremiobacteraeota bacterium]